MIRQLFSRKRPAAPQRESSAPDIRNRLARTIQQSSQPQRAGLDHAARDVLDLLGRRDPEDGYIRGHDAEQIVTGLLRNRHPAQFAVALATALPQLQPGTTHQHNVLARNYRTVFSYATGLAMRHEERWPLDKEDLAQALRAYRRHLASARLGDFGGRAFLGRIAMLAGESGDHDLRELLQDLIETALADQANRDAATLDEIDRWIGAAQIQREDIPTLRTMDATALRLQGQRDELIGSAPPLLGPALECVLDGGLDPAQRAKDIPPAIDELLKASRKERGAALAFLLDRMVASVRINDFAELARRAGRWAHEFADCERPVPALAALAFELAKRTYDLADPDPTHQKLVKLLLAGKRHEKESHRNILKPLLTTIAEHPKGLTVQALKRLLRDPEYDRWHADIEQAMEAAGSSERNTGPNAHLAPLELPQFVIGDFDHLQVFEQHYANLFDPRLYLDPHDMLIKLLAEVYDSVANAPPGKAIAAEVEPRLVLEMKRLELPISFAQGRGLIEGAFFHHFIERARGFKDKRDAIRPLIEQHSHLMIELDRLAAQIADRPMPSASWIKRAQALYKDVPEATWLAQFEAIATQRVPATGMFGTPGEACVRTLIYLATFLPVGEAGPLLANYAVKECFAVESSSGMASETLGNACVWSLANLPDGAGFPYLARILARVKTPNVHRRINRALSDAARRAGITRSELDEATIPTHGLRRDGRREVSFKNGKAALILDGRGGRIEWMNPAGKPVSKPFLVTESERRHLADLRRDLDDLNADLTLLPQRLQTLYTQHRDWATETWTERYLDHPVMRRLAIRLIWSIERDTGQVELGLANAAGSGLLDLAGVPLDLAGARIRLWHPLKCSDEIIDQWRSRIEQLEIIQPFAQVWREVYALEGSADAAAARSDRWSGHVLREQVAAGVAQELGWSVVAAPGADDAVDRNWQIDLPEHDLIAKFRLVPVGPRPKRKRDKTTETLLRSESVTFHRARGEATESAAVKLAELPEPIYSEVMRHCDLITAAGSIAADPEWLARAAQADEAEALLKLGKTYWEQANSGPLEALGQRRRAMLARLIKRIDIGHQLTLTDTALRVAGQRGSYDIHLFAGACSMGGRTITIPPESICEPDDIWLPFEGDSVLLQVLAKARMFAADDLISDPDILDQIGG